jgi:hypothetical protein
METDWSHCLGNMETDWSRVPYTMAQPEPSAKTTHLRFGETYIKVKDLC